MGEYIAFVDSDDRIKEGSLAALYQEATGNRADVVMGNVLSCHQDGSIDRSFNRVAGEDILNNPLSGKVVYIQLVKKGFYLPMPFNYIHRRK